MNSFHLLFPTLSLQLGVGHSQYSKEEEEEEEKWTKALTWYFIHPIDGYLPFQVRGVIHNGLLATEG